MKRVFCRDFVDTCSVDFHINPTKAQVFSFIKVVKHSFSCWNLGRFLQLCSQGFVIPRASARMLRKCSHCGYNGHNSRTCLDSKGGFKLFGVRVSADCCASSPPGSVAPSECSSSSLTAMRKSVSMGNLSNYGSAEGGASPLSPSRFEQADVGDPVEGYASDDLVHTNSSSRERKKGEIFSHCLRT